VAPGLLHRVDAMETVGQPQLSLLVAEHDDRRKLRACEKGIDELRHRAFVDVGAQVGAAVKAEFGND
jgi:hypothetical protein